MADLSQVPTVGKTLLPEADWPQIADRLAALPDTASKLECIGTDFPGLASIAAMALARTSPTVKEIQAVNHAILHHSAAANVPGRELGVGYQPRSNFKDLNDATLAHHPKFTPNGFEDITSKAVAHCDGVLYAVFQTAYVNTGPSKGQARGLHVETLFVPRDDEPFFLTSGIELEARGTGEKVETIIKGLYPSQPSPPQKPQGHFEKAHGTNPLDPALGQGNVLNADWFRNHSHMFANKMSKFDKDPSKVVYHTQGAVLISVSEEELSRAMGIRDIIMKSRENGVMASLGAHLGINSCAHCTINVLTLGGDDNARDDCCLPLDKVLSALIARGDAFYWTDTQGLRPTDFINEDGTLVEGHIPKVGAAVLQQKLNGVFSSPAVLTSNVASRPSYANQYLGFHRVPAGAEELYEMVLKIVLSALKEKLATLEAARG